MSGEEYKNLENELDRYKKLFNLIIDNTRIYERLDNTYDLMIENTFEIERYIQENYKDSYNERLNYLLNKKEEEKENG
jgi:hypothetical protein